MNSVFLLLFSKLTRKSLKNEKIWKEKRKKKKKNIKKFKFVP